ncbi:MAG: hypothetical protein KF817_00805 [Phycisphaeraceae bacterium]|nr:hypothetical protein [Phycisphaeraceae bacterium]
MLHASRSCLRALVLTATAMVALPVTSLPGGREACAQYGGAAGFAEVMAPYYLRRDLRIFEDGLALDAAQASVIETLFFNYEQAQSTARDEMMQAIEGLRDRLASLEREEQVRIIFEPFIAMARKWDEGRERFLQDVRVVLNEEQNRQWPEFLKRLRREKELPKGELSGESVDLILILKQLGISPAVERQLRPAIAAYADALDEALARRERQARDSRIALMSSMRDADHSTSLRIYREQLDLRTRVRNVNDDFIEVFALALPEELSEKYRTMALEQAYSKVFRPSAGYRVLEAATRLELEEERAARVAELFASFLAEYNSINGRYLEVLRRWEPREAAFRAEQAALPRETHRAPMADDARAVFTEREEMTRRYINMLQDMLTREEFLDLPGASRYYRSLENTPRAFGTDPAGADEAAKRKEKDRMNTPASRLGSSPPVPRPSTPR